MREFKNLCYCENGVKDQSLDLYLPDDSEFSLFVYFHGGGLESGDKTREETVLLKEYLTKRGIGVASVNYRMYPDAKFPQFIEDCALAVSYLKNSIHEYGKLDKFYVGGSSAGGYLSMMLCFDKSYLGKYNISPMDITAFIHDAGQPTTHFNVLREMNINPERIIVDGTSPLFYVGTSENYPPMLIIVSDNDISNRYDQTKLFMSTLDKFGFKDTATLKVMHGTHCHYFRQKLDNEEGSVFAKIIFEYIKGDVL